MHLQPADLFDIRYIEVAARRSNPTPKARGGSREEQPQVQGEAAVLSQEGLEEPSHVEGQEGKQ